MRVKFCFEIWAKFEIRVTAGCTRPTSLLCGTIALRYEQCYGTNLTLILRYHCISMLNLKNRFKKLLRSEFRLFKFRTCLCPNGTLKIYLKVDQSCELKTNLNVEQKLTNHKLNYTNFTFVVKRVSLFFFFLWNRSFSTNTFNANEKNVNVPCICINQNTYFLYSKLNAFELSIAENQIDSLSLKD